MPDNEVHYRAICKSAVVSFVFAIIGLSAWLAAVFAVIPIFGLFFGILALINLKRFPEELMGKRLAVIATLLNLVIAVGSISYHSIVYATEVPKGYERLSFWELQPGKISPYPYSERAIEMNGKKVFIKGYVRPGVKQRNLKKFILVGDFKTCCFGGNPQITDIVAVTIKGDQTVDYSLRLRKVTGEFRLNPQTKAVEDEKDIPAVFYEIIADEVK